MQTNDELEKEINKRGGRFELRHQDDIFSALNSKIQFDLKLTREHFYTLKPRKLDYAFLRNGTLGAFAYASSSAEKDPFDFIGIHIGTLYTITDTFYRMLAHPNILTNIGAPHKESPENTYVTEQHADLLHRIVALDLERTPCRPQDSMRTHYANSLMQTAISFVVWHEISHLVRGHCDFKKEIQNTSFISEAISSSSSADWLLSHTLEWDADSIAVRNVLESCHFTMTELNERPERFGPEEFEVMSLAYGTPEKILQTILFATYTLFRLYDIDKANLLETDLKTTSHPPLPYRQLNIINSIEATFLTQYKGICYPDYENNKESFREATLKALESVEEAYAYILNAESADPRGFNSLQETPELLREYNDSLFKKYYEILPELDKHKRCEAL